MSSNQHISHEFDEELEQLRNKVLKMGGLVEKQVRNAISALTRLDAIEGVEVCQNDHQVNTLEVGIDEDCVNILARRQPAASDLRMVIAVIKTITDLERIGDEAERIAKMAVRIAEEDGIFHNRYSGINHLADHVQYMVHGSLNAFTRMDVDEAIVIKKADKKVDEEYKLLMRSLITYMMEDPRTISETLDVAQAARALERIGDHAKNICEYVIYLVHGKNIRHVNMEEVEQDLLK
jgi:phosphate transport system protein